jgi:copper chaperone CopZ
MMKKVVMMMAVVTSFMGFGLTAQAAQNRIIDVSVNGMVCDFCAQSLKKIFGKQQNVEKVDISLETKKIVVTLKPEKDLSDDVVTKLITDSGYAVEAISRR